MTQNTDVVVIGAGYAGVMAANRMTQRDDVGAAAPGEARRGAGHR